jgi:hypothetical protein
VAPRRAIAHGVATARPLAVRQASR